MFVFVSGCICSIVIVQCSSWLMIEHLSWWVEPSGISCENPGGIVCYQVLAVRNWCAIHNVTWSLEPVSLGLRDGLSSAITIGQTGPISSGIDRLEVSNRPLVVGERTGCALVFMKMGSSGGFVHRGKAL